MPRRSELPRRVALDHLNFPRIEHVDLQTSSTMMNIQLELQSLPCSCSFVAVVASIELRAYVLSSVAMMARFESRSSSGGIGFLVTAIEIQHLQQ